MTRQDQAPRRMAAAKPNTFFGGAAILAMGILVVKVIGLFYKIPLVNIIGSEGSADFNNAYNIYSVLLTISTAGLPVAVSKMVSEANALGRQNQVHKVFRLSLAAFLTLGVVSFLIMYFGSEQLAGMMHDSLAAAGIRALAPAVICVGCLSAFRGYAQGHGNMTPTAVSQILEALCKLVIGLGLAYWLVRAGQPSHVAAAGAITGVTVGTILALAYMIFNFVSTRMREEKDTQDAPDSARRILSTLMKIAIPITISSSMVGIVTVIDSALVQGQIQKVLISDPDSWALYQQVVDFAPLEAARDAWQQAVSSGAAAEAVSQLYGAVELAAENISRSLYGNYSGALTIYNLPLSLMAAITASVIAAVSAALARRDRRGAARITGSALRITALLAFPMGVGLFVLGTPIIRLIFPELDASVAGPLLSTLGIASIFVCLMLVCNSVLQAHGFINLPVVIMALGGVVKIVTNYNLVAVPTIGISGAPVGNVLCFGLCMVLDLVVIARVIHGRPDYLPLLAKPAAAAGVMGLGAWAVYGLLSKLLSYEEVTQAGETIQTLGKTGNGIAVMGAILIAVIIYAVLVVALRAISREDLSLMPKGDKIAKILRL
ncbi:MULTISPECIES: polysaccharide biosynthesis protein [Eubacteriales]|uniref:putative polysaccharide biosynthesis protein n=1 Tax=Eubacteriales TaxID=186802 RepID=UPI000AF4DF37|nr:MULTISPECIES: polysaccharide biosynthesis protein [Eubacteriales]MCB5927458.1 polysaccharide biosynthesis protein [bacterium 210820-DFI.5.26]MCQ5160561.1 polysaccharide biosynthesis protein [Clostridium sp. DFI.5.61]MEE0112907.1 polysaccharide biosynthesis protein [Eubacteriales bacterium]UMM46566.1 polysaccharide biosynthesis protein [Lawsonibacter asaccharolyticus]